MSRLDLVLHCGAHAVDPDQVRQVATPEGTDTWFPIPHESLIDLVEKQLPEYGLSVVQEQHTLMRDDHRYFGLYQVQADGHESADYGLVLGLRNSHDKSFPAGLCLGSGVFVCDNLAFSAEVVIGRRHTRYIMDDLPRLIAAALGRLVTARVDQDRRIEAYKTTEVGDQEAAHLLMRLFDAKAVKKTQLADIWELWRNPTHGEQEREGKTAWRLFNSVTEIQRGINPFELSARTQRMHPLLDTVCGIAIGSSGLTELDNVIDAEFTINGRDERLI